MPRGKPGTGSGARKRVQRNLGYSKDSDAYIKLQLSKEEAKLVYARLKTGPEQLGTREGAIATNIMYRITEQVMGVEA